MSRGSKRVVCGVALACAAAAPALADDRFIDTRALARHRNADLPAIPGWAQLLTAAPLFPLRSERVPAYAPATDTAAARPAAVTAMAAADSLANITSMGAKATSRFDGGTVGAGVRRDGADDYFDGRGKRVAFGYRRDTEYLVAQHAPDPKAGNLTLLGVRDVFERLELPNYGLDGTRVEQGGIKLGAAARLTSGWFDRVEADAAWSMLHVEADNFSLRAPGSARLAYPVDTETVRAAATLVRDRDSGRTEIGFDASRATVNSKRESWEYGTGAISAYRLPAIENVRAGVSASHRLPLDAQTSLEGGMRYDLVQSSADDVHRVPAIAAYALSPQQIYNTAYGTVDNDVREHNLSARIRAEHRLDGNAATWLDLGRLMRTADSGERWFAQYGASTLFHVGNPQIEPEKHNRAELGGRVEGGGFKRYGWGAPAGAWRLVTTAAVDRVEDFISVDRARGQAGVRAVSSKGVVYRNVDVTLASIGGELQAMPLEWLGVRLVASGTRGRNNTDHRPLYQVDPFETDLFVDLFGGEGALAWNLGLRTRLVGGKRAVDDSVLTGSGMDYGGPAGAFATFDLYGGVRLNDRLALSAGVENLFDKLYREHVAGFPQSPTTTVVNAPGRTFFTRAVVNF